MNIIHQKKVYELASNLKFKFSHFVRGSCVYNSPVKTNYNVNRLMFVLENTDGAANYIEDNSERFILQPGFCYLVPAFHPTLYIINEKLKFISIHFRLEYFSGNDIVSLLKRNIAMKDHENTALLNQYFGSESELYQAILLNKVVYQTVERCLGNEISTMAQMEERFSPWRNVIEYMNQNCTALTGVNDLALVAGMSRAAFTRKFTSETGISPKKFFNRILAQRAAELLLKPSLYIYEIAAKLQFSNEYAFSRFFKNQLGMAPQEYRKQIRF